MTTEVLPAATTPTFYRVSASRLTTDPVIECSGGASSGDGHAVARPGLPVAAGSTTLPPGHPGSPA